MALSNYLEDDWDDNALSGRSGAQKDVFYQYGTGGTGDLLKGVYRPLWSVESGSASATNSQLEIPNGSDTTQRVETASNFLLGQWSSDFTVASSTSRGAYVFNLFSSDVSGYSFTRMTESYFVAVVNNGDYALRKYDGGQTDILMSTWPNDTATHTHKTTRDSYGNFELFLDGTSQGTATDTAIVGSIRLGHANDIDSQVNVDNLIVK